MPEYIFHTTMYAGGFPGGAEGYKASSHLCVEKTWV